MLSCIWFLAVRRKKDRDREKEREKNERKRRNESKGERKRESERKKESKRSTGMSTYLLFEVLLYDILPLLRQLIGLQAAFLSVSAEHLCSSAGGGSYLLAHLLVCRRMPMSARAVKCWEIPRARLTCMLSQTLDDLSGGRVDDELQKMLTEGEGGRGGGSLCQCHASLRKRGS
eukprot:1480825-Rhodomonas_salina.1